MTPLILIGVAALALIALNVLCWPDPEEDHRRRLENLWKDEER
jgi:hypothetical protein